MASYHALKLTPFMRPKTTRQKYKKRNMELKENFKKVLQIFRCTENKDLKQAVEDAVFGSNRELIFEEYLKSFPELKLDFLQKVYQFYFSDREEKKQDFTPVCLAQLMAALTFNKDEKKCLDCCCGTGSLLIQKWVLNKNLEFVCLELDENVIPFLLFNLCIRNIEATVVRYNVLTGESICSYSVKRGQRFSIVEQSLFAPSSVPECDTAISNPPFNLKEESTNEQVNRFAKMQVKGNYAFIWQCLCISQRYSALILPAGALSLRNEDSLREAILPYLKAAVLCAGNMFESTSVSVCILLFDKEKKDSTIMLVDASNMTTKEERKQRGESAAYGRVYIKTFNTYTPEQILAVCQLVEKEQDGFSKKVSIEEIKEHSYSLQLGVYLPISFDNYTLHRDFNSIIADINRIIRERNVLRITANKVWATKLGLSDLAQKIEESNNVYTSLNDSLKQIVSYQFEEFLQKDEYFKISNSKELIVENKDKEHISNIFQILLPMWHQHVSFLNEEENRLLAELRDAMLPYLMNGDLSFEN